MMNKSLLRVVISLVVLLSFMAFAWPVLAQTPTPPPTPRDALMQAIQARAQRDVELGKQAESVSGLQVLFGTEAQAVGMTMNEVVTTYETAYQAAKKANAQPWDNLPPIIIGLGGLIAGALLVVFKDYLAKFFKRMTEAAYQKLAGYRLFWTFSLRHYRKALEQNHQELKISFRPGRPLNMQDVYVPLRIAGRDSRKAVDAYQEMQKHKWLMVVGAPGSGKSMLLRHLALMYARKGLNDFPHQPVPVLLELNRLKDSSASLFDQLTKILELNDFPKADGFVKAALKRGQLLLLLDGLDEVSTQAREHVVAQIKDMLTEHHEIHTVITCRTQVYHDEFADLVDHKLEIVEFSDQQIQRFLTAWEPDMPEGKSIEQFLRTLRERPQIMALARNPLLLTMIAYLYTDTAFVLPHSRAEFYVRATALLLEQWKVERNRYKAGQKRLALQSLAFFNQSGQAGGDRRSIEFPVVLSQIRSVLPSLTLKDDDAQPMLDEIVERSGLLLPVDGGVRYQFTHLTLQEFFAALALESRSDDLLTYFSADRDGWREVVRLWCGLEHDSTGLIRKVYGVDPILAFECLGDAQQVEPACVDELVSLFENRLAEAIGNESLAHALALVAADPRPHGAALFGFLKDSLARLTTRLAAATTLSSTNLPKAADAIAKYAEDDPNVRTYLIKMGDLAIPALTAWASLGNDWAFDALCEIGTPSAAQALTPLLWVENRTISYQTAWRLAALLHQPNVDATLRLFDLTPIQRKAGQIGWIWEPFEEPADSALPVIAGRTAHLLHASPAEAIPSGPPSTVDPRLVIPLCAIVSQDGQFVKLGWNARKELIKALQEIARSQAIKGIAHPILGQDDQNAFVANYIDQVSTHPTWRRLFHSLPSVSQFNLLRCLIFNEPIPTREDWRSIFRPVTYIFDSSWQARGIKLLLTLMCLLNMGGIAVQIAQSAQFWNWGNILALLWGITTLLVLFPKWNLNNVDLLLSLLLWGSGLGVAIVFLTENWILGVVAGSIIIVVGNVIASAGAADVADILTGTGGLGATVGGVLVVVILGVFFASVAGGGVVGGFIVFAIVVIIAPVVGSIDVLDGAGNGANLVGVSGVFVIWLGYWPTTLLYGRWNWPSVVLFWLIWVTCMGLLFWYGRRQERRAQNPLHGLLDQEGQVSIEYPRKPLRFMRWLLRQ